MNVLVKIYFIIGMFLINAKPIFCSRKLRQNFFSAQFLAKWNFHICSFAIHCALQQQQPSIRTSEIHCCGDLRNRQNFSCLSTPQSGALPLHNSPWRDVMESFKVGALQFRRCTCSSWELTWKRLNFYMFRLVDKAAGKLSGLLLATTWHCTNSE